MYCHNCGAKFNPDTDKFCTKCGVSFYLTPPRRNNNISAWVVIIFSHYYHWCFFAIRFQMVVWKLGVPSVALNC